ncbi:histidine protein kinase [Fusarium langsethiae]|uniref:Histidine protein kinase n=1 Tax=Fusarium langsethiae TaxID=179993 RepID=A0A0N0V7S1_FUSLA|nr:histidine protein kinase [Fusarium langsethiae]
MKTVTAFLKKLVIAIWADRQTNDLWKQIVKSSIACLAAVTAVITPQAVAVIGPVTFLAPMATIFAHPGQRTGLTIEALVMLVLGTAIGLGWSILGIYLSSLIVDESKAAAYTIRGIFLAVAAVLHGYIRSAAPRIFLFVAFYLIACLIVLLGKQDHVSLSVLTNIAYPTLVGAGISLVTNLSMFPESSSNFLGLAAIDALCETMDTLTRATHWFITPGGDSHEELSHVELTMTSTVKSVPEKPKRKKNWFTKRAAQLPNPFKPSQNRYRVSTVPVGLATIASLTSAKGKLRSRLAQCKNAQREVNYEITFSVLPPRSMKPLTTSQMSNLVQNITNIIGACENKFAVVENDDGSDDDSVTTADSSNSEPNGGITRMDTFEAYQQKLENAKPPREVELSNASLLETIIARIREPTAEFDAAIKDAVRLVITCVAYCYDVPKLPSRLPVPKDISLHDLDYRIDLLAEAIVNFDTSCSSELRQLRMDERGNSVDFMPRHETFLISSFVLGVRQSATHVLQMLHHIRKTVEQRQARHNRATFWFPKSVDTRQFWKTGGESDGLVLPETARKPFRHGKSKHRTHLTEKDANHTEPEIKDEERAIRFVEPSRRDTERKNGTEERKGKKSKAEGSSRVLRMREKAADIIEWMHDSNDLFYAVKLAFAVLLLSWPALVDAWNPWYSGFRAVWAPMQLFLVFEVAIGTSVYVFIVRLLGVVFGCFVGFISYLVGDGNKIGVVLFLIVGVVPSFYVQLGTKYVKAGMICTVSMVVVALSSVNGTATPVDNFTRRLCAFLVGGLVAVAVEMFVFPVRARDRLLDTLSVSIKQVQNMQAAMAVGLDSPAKPDFRDPGIIKRFNFAKDQAQTALAAADTFLPMCLKEPRLKGDFKPLYPIYKEIVVVLRQIVERMDNAVSLRREYGSSILEDLHPQVYTYRRNVAASIMLLLFSVHEALITWQPLPQFMPACRLAHFRLINRVREILYSRSGAQTPAGGPPSVSNENFDLAEEVARLIVQKRSLSWNASTYGQGEIIEYLEELVELTKILVGVNAFRSGLLEEAAPYSKYDQRARLNRIPLSRAPTADTTTTVAAEEVPTASSALAPTESRATGLQRTQTIRRASLTRRRAHQRGEKGEESDSEEDIPVSLQRVGTRICENNALIRRRTIVVSNDDR